MSVRSASARPPGSPNRSEALIVFAKVPEPGRVKTRLTALLSPEEAARLYTAFLGDSLDQYATLDADVRLYLAGKGSALPMLQAVGTLHRQEGGSLGERMLHAFVTSFAAGYERLVIIGTDHPTLPTAFIEQAFVSLHEPLSICIGPSDDGGFYLLGMNDFFPDLFYGMTYSHARVFAETMERAAASQAQLTVLPGWFDVDTPASLRRLAGDLSAGDASAPRTRRMMLEFVRRYPELAR